MSNIRLSTATDREVLKEIGERLRSLREARNLTQTEAAQRAGIARRTLYAAEQGDNPTLQTLIRLLRAYSRLEALENFIPRPEISPMARLRDQKES